jgi:hypothetical protein
VNKRNPCGNGGTGAEMIAAIDKLPMAKWLALASAAQPVADTV